MKKIAIFVLLFLVSILTFNINAQGQSDVEKWSAYFPDIMGSFVAVEAYIDASLSKSEQAAIRDDVEKILHMHTYLSKTEFSDVTEQQKKVYNKGKEHADIKVSLEDINNRVGEKIEISYDLFKMLEIAEEIRIETDGYFDYSIGKVIDVWKDGINRYKFREIPTSDFNKILDELDKIEIAENPITLTIEQGRYFVEADELAQLDLGAFAKGYVTQKVVDYFRDMGVKSYLINSGQSSIAVGEKVDGSSYKIGLKNPTDFGPNVYAVANVKNEIITTSGDHDQYFLYNGERFHHIISPKTKTPLSNYHILTIVGKDAGLMDAYSTAIFSMPIKEAKAFLESAGSTGIFYNTDLTIDKLSETFEINDQPEPSNLGRYIILGVYIIIAVAAIIAATVYFIKQQKKVIKPKNFKLRRDLILFGVLVLLFGGGFLNYYFWPRPTAQFAEITYRNEVYVEVDFQSRKVNTIKYQPEGYPKITEDEYITEVIILGDYQEFSTRQEVVIEIDFRERKIRVSEERSPNNYCSKQSWTTNGYIICLPNAVTIHFKTSLKTDGVV